MKAAAIMPTIPATARLADPSDVALLLLLMVGLTVAPDDVFVPPVVVAPVSEVDPVPVAR